MKLTKVTITGADDNTNHNDLVALSEKYPFVEWGILFSPTRYRTNRYPSLDWVSGLVEAKKTNLLSLSAHLCGDYTRQLLSTGIASNARNDIGDDLDKFERVQFNFNASKHDVSESFYEIFFSLKGKEGFVDQNYIIQYNTANLSVCQRLASLNLSLINFLYDSSGGRGVLPPSYNPVIPGHYTGYSGGLGPENIDEALNRIEIAAGDNEIWVDVETGVRTNDQLDLTKVESFLMSCQPHVK